MEEAKQFQQLGNGHFSAGRFPEALQAYAAALASLQSSNVEDEELAAVLCSNRSACCLKLGQGEQALEEAEKCKELSPEWPKAHFRLASAHEFLGNLGDARLSACEARRLAPEDREVERLQSQLRKRIFKGQAAKLGEALDCLEDFTTSSTKTVSAAQTVYDMLIGNSASQEERNDCVRAYVAGKGFTTVDRRQNAMGDNWQEECKNGTMSLLSKIAAAWPKLAEEARNLSFMAEEVERHSTHGHTHAHGHTHDANCTHAHGDTHGHTHGHTHDHTHGHTHDHTHDTSCAGDKAPLEEEQPRREGGKKSKKGLGLKAGFLKGETLSREGAGEKAAAPVAGPVAQEKPSKAPTPASAEWLLRILLMLPVDNMPFAFGAYQAVSRRWRAAALDSLLGDDVSDGAAALFSSWAERLRPGIAGLLMRGCSLHLVKSMRRKLGPPKALPGPEQWLFVVDVWRDARLLWSSLMDGSNFLPGMRDRDCAGEPGAAAPEVWPNVMEKMDVILPGDKRRLAVAGCIAAMTALLKEKKEGCPYPEGEHAANVTAVHVNSGVSRVVPAVLMPGSRRSATAAVPVGDVPRALLRAVVGLGAQQVMPGPKAAYPSGSLEVSTGLAFLGPDGRWLQGGAFVLTALLGALRP